MTCISPPKLDDQTLLLFLDGHAPASVAAHIEQCTHCRKSARQLARVQSRLVSVLYRFECPSPDELGDYYLGVLPAAAAASIEQHLPNCPHCRREIAQLESYLASLEPDAPLDLVQEAVDRARVWIARLVSGGPAVGPLGFPAPAPAYGGLRGDVTQPALVYEAEDAQVIVEIRPLAQLAGRWDALGLLLGLDETSHYEAQLWQDEERVAVAQLDELGNFVLSGLPTGAYKLILASPDLKIHIQPLQVGPTDHGP